MKDDAEDKDMALLLKLIYDILDKVELPNLDCELAPVKN